MVTGGGDEIKLKISGVLHAMFYNTSGAASGEAKPRRAGGAPLVVKSR
jgi:hypothetical protein